MENVLCRLRPPMRQGLRYANRTKSAPSRRCYLPLNSPSSSLVRPGCEQQAIRVSVPQRPNGLRNSSDHAVSSRKPSVSQVDEELDTAHRAVRTVLESSSIPSEVEVLETLQTISIAARHLLELNNLDRPVSYYQTTDKATSALLSLDSRRRKPAKPTPESAPLKKTIDELSDSAYRLVKFQNTFLTKDILSSYVNLQAILHRPSTFPEIFTLYATKPAPHEPKSPNGSITYTPSSHKAIAAAIDADVANTALDVATTKRDLSLAFDIIEAAFGAPAFQRNKIFRLALPPIIATVLMPVAAFSIASQLSAVQNGMDPSDFTKVAFAGLFTYAGVVGSLGYVTMTTVNDQMQRVTWAIGMPLHERWLREEQRAAADRVALAWGFPEKIRWGEEEGDDWETIREWCGVRGMVLDKVGLMEGMD